MIKKTADTFEFRIYIAGFQSEIERLCQKFCTHNKGCVSVKPATFCYNYGREEGCEVTLINYPKFAKTYDDLAEFSSNLAEYLLIYTDQKSCSLTGPKYTTYLTKEE